MSLGSLQAVSQPESESVGRLIFPIIVLVYGASFCYCLLIQKYFCAFYHYAGKADLSKGY